MELDDPNLPPLARAWALTGADRVSEWVTASEAGVLADPVDALASTLLGVIEDQARIIGELSARVDALSGPSGR